MRPRVGSRWARAAAALVAVLAWPFGTAMAGATHDLEQSATFLDQCAFHFGQLESDARQAGRDFCSNLGGVQSIDDFEHHEELVRENEFSKKYHCTVTSRVECYASE